MRRGRHVGQGPSEAPPRDRDADVDRRGIYRMYMKASCHFSFQIGAYPQVQDTQAYNGDGPMKYENTSDSE